MNPKDSKERLVQRFPSAEMTAEEFEVFVFEEFEQTRPHVDDLRVTLHDVVQGVDGLYDFDATIRYTLAGLDFLVVVEAKRHKHPIKRETVQTLHSKIRSVGAHKGVVVSTAPFQQGALVFASVHNIALVTITEGRWTVESRTGAAAHPMSRAEAAALGVPAFVAHCYAQGAKPGSVTITAVSEDPEHATHVLLGL